MRTALKGLGDMGTLHDLRRPSVKSGKPALPTTAILNLYMRGNEKMRIEGELKRVRKRRVQLLKRLKDVEREMSKLYIQATDMAGNLRGKSLRKDSSVSAGRKAVKGKVVVAY
jgi:hypothetical protein